MSSVFLKGIFTGVITSFLFVSIYTFTIYQTAKPGFHVSENKSYTEKEVNEITGALVKLSGISNFFGVDQASALFTGSAAVILGEKSPLLANFHFARAIEIANKISIDTNNYNPLLEVRYSYGLFLNDIGSKEEAKKYIAETLQIGLKKSPKSHWILNLKNAQKYLDKDS